MNKCSKCNVRMDNQRIHLGYTDCPKCSETEKYSAHVVYPHKTGAFVQPVSETASKNLKRMDRRSVGGSRTAKGIYVDNSWDRWLEDYKNGMFEPKKPPVRSKPIKVRYIKKSVVIKDSMTIYKRDGIEVLQNYLTDLYKRDKISLMTKTSIYNQFVHIQAMNRKERKKLLRTF
jgi:hypothetical protein